MNENIFHQKLNLPFKINHSSLDLPAQRRAFSISKYEVIDQRIIDLIDCCGAYPVHTEYFALPPRGIVTVHVDDGLLYNRTKLNMFVGTGLMRWFDPLPEFKNKQISYTEIGSPFISFLDHEVQLIHENQMFGDYIINPGIPHNFLNNSSENCWVVSFVLFDKNTQTFLLFEDAVERLKEYIIGD